jgi:hypothetical protein
MSSLSMVDMMSRSMAEPKKKKGWIKKGASKHPGLFRKKAERAGETTREFAEEKKDVGGKLGKEANFALNAVGAAKKRKSPLYRKD